MFGQYFEWDYWRFLDHLFMVYVKAWQILSVNGSRCMFLTFCILVLNKGSCSALNAGHGLNFYDLSCDLFLLTVAIPNGVLSV